MIYAVMVWWKFVMKTTILMFGEGNLILFIFMTSLITLMNIIVHGVRPGDMQPATQCAHENTYQGTVWQTTFVPQNLCAPVGHIGK